MAKGNKAAASPLELRRGGLDMEFDVPSVGPSGNEPYCLPSLVVADVGMPFRCVAIANKKLEQLKEAGLGFAPLKERDALEA